MNSYAAIFLVLIHLAHNWNWYVLGEMFNVNHQTCANVFYTTISQLFLNRSNIPILVDPNGQVNQAEVDKMLESAYNNTPVYFRELVKDFKDPSSRNRLPVIIQVWFFGFSFQSIRFWLVICHLCSILLVETSNCQINHVQTDATYLDTSSSADLGNPKIYHTELFMIIIFRTAENSLLSWQGTSCDKGILSKHRNMFECL